MGNPALTSTSWTAGATQPKICFVTAGGDHPAALANALDDHFGGVVMMLEEPESKRDLLLKRARKLGWVSAAGQLATMMLIRFGKSAKAAHINRFIEREKLNVNWTGRTIRVPSVNDGAFLKAVAELQPDIIVLTGCRMMRASVLGQLPCPVINYHAGITPKYRGMNGGYWALANGEPGEFGGTIHMVDKGVDTGAVLAHVRCTPEPGDTIMTYAYTMVAAVRAPAIKVVEDVFAGTAKPVATGGRSAQWYHPPLWTYLRNGLFKGVW